MSDRTVRNWRHGKNLPADLRSIEAAFFGDTPAYAAELQALRAAHSGRASADENIQRAKRIVPPDQCIGREGETANVVAALTKQARSVIVLGPPGVGKTTLTRQVMSSPLVAEHFGAHRWLVELDTVRDVMGLRDAVLFAMGMDPDSRSFSDALDQLERCGPTLLVLDNLETPWEAQMVEVEACLQQMIVVPGLSLLASMRGNVMPPLPGVVLSVELQPLATTEAQLLFLRLAGRIAPDDPHLNPLLAELGGIPLAITLVAYRAAPHDTLEDLWDEWRERGIALATRPDIPEGRLTSVARSIDISLGSLRLRDEGRRLFHLLGQLPNGIARNDRKALLGQEATAATGQLLSVGLAFSRVEGRLDLLPPIRAFARAYQKENVENIDWISHYLGIAADLLIRLKEPEDSATHDGARRSLLIEQANIEAAYLSAENESSVSEENISATGAKNALSRLQRVFGNIQDALSYLGDEPADPLVSSSSLLRRAMQFMAAHTIQENMLDDININLDPKV